MTDTISCLAADYNNNGFSRKIPRLCQEWPKISMLWIIGKTADRYSEGASRGHQKVSSPESLVAKHF